MGLYATALLVGPGSSLGGTRSDAAVRDAGGELALARFPGTEVEPTAA